jgi:plasmid stabilization system protein ParE
VDRKEARSKTVAQACEWFMDRIAPVDTATGKRVAKSQHAKNQLSKLKYWINSEFAPWSLVSLKPWDLIDWRDQTMDEEGCSAQTIVHRLNTLSQVSTKAIAAFKSLLPENVTVLGKRPVFPVETPRAFGHAWRDVVTDQNFPDFRWHDLRHEAISRLFERTDLRDNEIMAVSGHLRPEMLTRYTHLRADRLDDPVLAARIGGDIFCTIQGLSDFPLRGRPGRVDGAREMVLAGLPWIAVYAVTHSTIVVLRLLHGAQAYPTE